MSLSHALGISPLLCVALWVLCVVMNLRLIYFSERFQQSHREAE